MRVIPGCSRAVVTVCIATLLAQGNVWAIGADTPRPASNSTEQKSGPESDKPKPKLAARPATQAPRCSDPIHIEDYEPGKIYRLKARRGYVSQIQLGTGDIIAGPAFGGDTDGWEVDSPVGGTVVAVKPRKSATQSNLIVRTQNRSYVIALDLVPELSPCQGDWQLVFRVPPPPVVLAAESPEKIAAREALLESRLIKEAAKETLPGRNWAYSMQALRGSDDIVPTEVYDDGRFTYIRIPGNRELPSVFRIAADGTESFVERHMQGRDLMVIHEVSRRWVLRLDKQTVGLWNDDFDIEGVPPVAGTSSARIKRVVRGGENNNE